MDMTVKNSSDIFFNENKLNNLKNELRLKKEDDLKLKEVCEEFESMLVKIMLGSMRKTVNRDNSLVNKNMGEDIFEDMLYDEYSKKMAKTADFGVANLLYKQLISSNFNTI
jgi:flagellar protein FlgJ